MAVATDLLDDGHDVSVLPPPGDKLESWALGKGVPAGELSTSNPALTEADLVLAAHNTRFISASLRAAIGGPIASYHPSLLPRHRGMDSVRWTIEMGDPIAGGTVYLLDDGWDTGPIVLQDWCHVAPGWSASDLWREELFPMGVRLIRQVVREHQRTGGLISRPQDERFATFEESFEVSGRRACQPPLPEGRSASESP
ncbi:MAG: formyltransferase family protein [Solirubrobacteraceae bacterium]